MSIKIISDSSSSTKEIGRKLGALITENLCLAKMLHKKNAIALYGDLGAGKTTFVQGFARGLGVPESYYITSPTYNIINEYPTGLSKVESCIPQTNLSLYHIDLYRIGSPDELEYIGFDDIVTSNNSVIIIEWPDIISKGSKNIILFDLEVRIKIDNHFNREISFIPYGLDSINLLKQFV